MQKSLCQLNKGIQMLITKEMTFNTNRIYRNIKEMPTMSEQKEVMAPHDDLQVEIYCNRNDQMNSSSPALGLIHTISMS